MFQKHHLLIFQTVIYFLNLYLGFDIIYYFYSGLNFFDTDYFQPFSLDSIHNLLQAFTISMEKYPLLLNVQENRSMQLHQIAHYLYFIYLIISSLYQICESFVLMNFW
jgi:hypothetical protein